MKTKTPILNQNRGLLTLCAHLGSNQGPKDYESSTLTNWAIGPEKRHSFFASAMLQICIEIRKMFSAFFHKKNEYKLIFNRLILIFIIASLATIKKMWIKRLFTYP